MKKISLRQWIDWGLMALVAVLIIVTAIRYGQPIYKTLPTLITLVVLLFQARANRFGFLIGGINSLLYSFSYYTDGLMFSAISGLVISFPLQIITFVQWSRHRADNGITRFRHLSVKHWAVILPLFGAAYCLCYFGLARFFNNATFPALDIFIFVLGIVVTVLTTMRMVDAPYLNLVSCLIQLVMWILLTIQNPASFNYLIITGYNVIRITQAAVEWTRQYRMQCEKNKKHEGTK
ncbi:MAG: nicotinamide mononucleotide transporter [Clostridia bacterium]|nr:nicotinamide mononucleotide transporter [Clostridia bacterium]